MGLMWSTVTPVTARPLRKHCWHKCLSLALMVALSLSHGLP
ncbi:hypothetical protein XBFFL1_1230004 [Xenorhabdus bovienii str. feltiae Florida]|uniref:Uncharacterized protein n=1 Tax=Xenorhabdus bovienii str. feltiae Moldova TaxID=1398200 RepID=A0A077NRW9_XENBV|nr:hypothetical protein XBFFL1_1230004 [Xenorhabdus bovienii str. feltiae Florida]CDH00376.1 hypothetical protein XBFM1_1580018 [Xenorhabdus bovienii str. feltiae Moldova]